MAETAGGADETRPGVFSVDDRRCGTDDGTQVAITVARQGNGKLDKAIETKKLSNINSLITKSTKKKMK